VQIQLTSQVDPTKFSKFQITVQKWSAGSWLSETLYAASTGATTKSYINGLTVDDSGYIHQAASSTVTYLVVVLYSYDLVDATSQVTVTFQYTPLPQASF
jgi:ABC-type thiamin/hydroxymethylpyrimidine transport system permease subunit